ncbi:MAG: hypothetical protein HFJ36_03645 [Clostridia bacterium]|nr:hypothetical protein [Clostridia bacterium]
MKDITELKINKENKGITLVALVITIIVLLILAGVAIATLTGENGILNKAQQSKNNTTLAQIEEEVKIAYNVVQTDATINGWDINKKVVELEKELQKEDSNASVILIEKDLLSNYKGYMITIYENKTVEIEDITLGEAPTGEVTTLTIEENVDSVEIKVTATTNDGSIETIESLNGATVKTDTSNNEKIFEVTQNGVYYFRIRGSNKRTAIVKSDEINNIIKPAESLLKGIEEITVGGLQSIKVQEEKYPLNVIYRKGNIELDGTTPIEGVNPTENKVYEFGSEDDVTKSGVFAPRTVVLKVDGDLTIGEEATITSVASTAGYGGPKGIVIYCTGTLTNRGKMSMTARGAYTEGQNVYLWKNSQDNSYETIPAVGASGGAAVYAANFWAGYHGKTGVAGSNRQTGGGGSGGAVAPEGHPTSGAGASGTSFSGGSGGGSGGGSINIFYNQNTSSAESTIIANGGTGGVGTRGGGETANGGAGGVGSVTKGSIATGKFEIET